MNSLPTLVQDSREQRPLVFDNLPIRGAKSLPVVVHKLNEGDYSVVGLEKILFIERKSIADLYGTIFKGRERFERELVRACNHQYKYLIIESTPTAFAHYINYERNPTLFNAAISTLTTYAERYSLRIRWTKTREGAAEKIARIAIRVAQEQDPDLADMP